MDTQILSGSTTKGNRQRRRSRVGMPAPFVPQTDADRAIVEQLRADGFRVTFGWPAWINDSYGLRGARRVITAVVA